MFFVIGKLHLINPMSSHCISRVVVDLVWSHVLTKYFVHFVVKCSPRSFSSDDPKYYLVFIIISNSWCLPMCRRQHLSFSSISGFNDHFDAATKIFVLKRIECKASQRDIQVGIHIHVPYRLPGRYA